MRSIRRALFVVAVTACLMPAAVPEALAHFCAPACSGGGMQCSRMAVKVGKGCRLACRATFPSDAASRRSCSDDCLVTVAADRAACQQDAVACQVVCDGTADQACADDICSVSYNQCRAAVNQATRDCLRAAGSDGVAVQACIEPGDALLGTGRAALDECISNMTYGLATCIAGC